MKISRFLLLCTITVTAATAQKLPTIQKKSLWAPANVKIDGRSTEWGEGLRAFNNATGINYTLANDDKNLYLAIQAPSLAMINKILGGGIDITINTKGEKSDKGAYIIGFPLVDAKNKSAQSSLKTKNMTTEELVEIRKKLTKTFKEIKLIGFKDIPENIIPIYNEYDITAAAGVDDQNKLIFELALPLKYFGESITNTGFAYNIKLNGIDFGMNLSGVTIEIPTDSYVRLIAQPQELANPTDFWGTYKLAKK